MTLNYKYSKYTKEIYTFITNNYYNRVVAPNNIAVFICFKQVPLGTNQQVPRRRYICCFCWRESIKSWPKLK